MLIFLFYPLVSRRSPRARQSGNAPRPFLMKADQVARGVAERGNPGCAPWEIEVRRLNDDAAVGGCLSKGGVDVVDPDGGQHARDSLAVEPCAAYVSCGVSEARVRCVSVPAFQAEYRLVEGSGPADAA